MNKEDRNTFLIIGVVLIICIASLIVVFSLIWRLISAPITQGISYISEAADTRRSVNYNFEIPEEVTAKENERKDEEKDKDESEVTPNPIVLALVKKAELKSEKEKQLLENAADKPIVNSSTGRNYYSHDGKYLIAQAGGTYDYNFFVREYSVPKNDEVVQLQSIPDAIISDAKLAGYGSNPNENAGSSQFAIKIPKIGIDSPVLQGLGADNLLEKGFWVHPNSGQLGKGVVTMLCHRRYFGPYDPRSCWFLDKVEVGDSIQIYFEEKYLNYKVVGTNVFNGDDPLIYSFNEEGDYIKLVTCTPLYSNAQRLVVLAKRTI